MNKPHTGKFIKCINCNESFYIPINRFNTAKYCSRKCKDKFCTIEIKSNCHVCNIEFSHISCRANKAKYCSRKCYYKSQIMNGTKQYKCHHCNKVFFDSPSCKRKYCSKQCVNKSNSKVWKPKFTTVRKKLLKLDKINKCQRCGFDEYPKILGVHHKDRNRNNNTISNLEILCPNCHSIEHKKHIVQ